MACGLFIYLCILYVREEGREKRDKMEDPALIYICALYYCLSPCLLRVSLCYAYLLLHLILMAVLSRKHRPARSVVVFLLFDIKVFVTYMIGWVFTCMKGKKILLSILGEGK